MEEQINQWFANGERGVSSEAMARAVAGQAPKAIWAKYGNYPHDEHDFRRCVAFLDAVPQAREHLDRVARLSPTWKRLVACWAELESLFRQQWAQMGSAPGVTERLRELGC